MLKAFTLIELLIVIALLGIISAIGVQQFTGHIASSHKKKAEVTMSSLSLAQAEYKSNNGKYCTSSNDCNSTREIVANLLDGVDNLTEQKYNFTISGSGQDFKVEARHKTSGCTISLTDKNIKKDGC